MGDVILDSEELSMMEKLRTKGESYKSFQDYSKNLKLSMLEKRYGLDSVEKSFFRESLDLLQQNIKVTTLAALVERLEVISRLMGLKFVAGPSVHWFIASDMFYLEVILELSGKVIDVKIHHEGKSEPQDCEEFKKCLMNHDFKSFTAHLQGLLSIYIANADKVVKSQVFFALRYLEQDISLLSNADAKNKDTRNLIYASNFGLVIKRSGGHPMKLVFFGAALDLLDASGKYLTDLENLIENENTRKIYASVLTNDSHISNMLQASSLASEVENDFHGTRLPLFALGFDNSIELPASFTLKLNAPFAICNSLKFILESVVTPLPLKTSGVGNLIDIIRNQLHGNRLTQIYSNVHLTDQNHRYCFSSSFSAESTILESVPFTHPGQIPEIFKLLRRQALLNELIASCLRPSEMKNNEKNDNEVSEIFLESESDSDSDSENDFHLSDWENSNSDEESTNENPNDKFHLQSDSKSRVELLSQTDEQSCVQQRLKIVRDVTFEVDLLPNNKISIVFEHLERSSLVTVVVDYSEVARIRCKGYFDDNEETNSLASALCHCENILQRTFSLPAMMRCLFQVWE